MIKDDYFGPHSLSQEASEASQESTIEERLDLPEECSELWDDYQMQAKDFLPMEEDFAHKNYPQIRKYHSAENSTSRLSEAQNNYLLKYFRILKSRISQKIIHNSFDIDLARTNLQEIHCSKEDIFSQIDDYFNQALLALQKRCEFLKEKYKKIEKSEIQRLEYQLTSLETSNEVLVKTLEQIEEMLSSNSASSSDEETKECYRSCLSNFQQASQKPSDITYFRPCSFECPTFVGHEEDLMAFSKLGEIRDNSHHVFPIVIFNTYNFEMLQYDDSLHKFLPCKVNPFERANFVLPKYFKYQVTSFDEVVLLGGSKELNSQRNPRKKVYIASDLAFKIFKGNLSQLDQVMNKPRQYFSLVHAKERNQIFIIGGFNEKGGALSSCEKLCLKTYTFSEIAPMVQKRYNCAATLVANQHIFVFNGVSKPQDLNTIEKYSFAFDFWEKLSIKTPFRVHNNFAKRISSDEILILGGKQDVGRHPKISRPMTSVFIFNTKSNALVNLPKLGFNYKIGDVFINNKMQALLFIPDTKKILIYDLEKNYPQCNKHPVASRMTQRECVNNNLTLRRHFSEKLAYHSSHEYIEMQDFNPPIAKKSGKFQDREVHLLQTDDVLD
ncbi:unnamed protein product [Moneuplotes crassus]|uniref:Kelch motif family protein n=1 Tax=Euplotes crassus TaxID=5936 RepID=A0AAD1U228_EUPCR|nr:unnamed protein product [Moneuplotes crassus]